MDTLADLVIIGVEGTSQRKDREHVVVAIIRFVMMLRPLAMTVEKVLLHVTLPIRIGVPDLIDGVMFALEGSLAEVEGHKLGSDVGDECIAHCEDCITPFVAGEEQVVTQDRLALIGGRAHGVMSSSTLHPNEFPMEVKIVGQPFTSTECSILSGTLGIGS